MSHKSDYEHLNKRVSQGNRRRKEADSEIRAEAAERDVAVLNAAKAYTDQEIAKVRRDLGGERSHLRAI